MTTASEVGGAVVVRLLSRLVLWFAIVTCLVGCGDWSSPAATPGSEISENAPAIHCPDGFIAEKDRVGCVEVAPASCPPGTRAAIGSSECQPVGVTECAFPFERAPSGWGCREIAPSTRCAGATMEHLGSRECVPIGDCGRPFPPANATHFVRADYADSELDATHFKTIASAYAAAPAGSLIAVDRGTYKEAIKSFKQVDLIGRCASEVIVQGPINKGTGPLPAFVAKNVKGITIDGFTFANHRPAISVEQSSVTVKNSLFIGCMGATLVSTGGDVQVFHSRIVDSVEDDVAGMAVLAQAGGKISLDDVAVIGSVGIGVMPLHKGSSISLNRSIVTGSRHSLLHPSTGGGGVGIDAYASLTMNESAVFGNASVALDVVSENASAVVERSVLRVEPFDGELPNNVVQVHEGAHLSLNESTIAAASYTGIAVSGPMSHADIASATLEASEKGCGRGTLVDDRATANFENVSVVGGCGTGIIVQDKGSALAFSRGLVRDTRSEDPSFAALMDQKAVALGTGASMVAGATLRIEDATFVHNTAAAIAAGAPEEEGGVLELHRVLVRDTQPRSDNRFGLGVQVTHSVRAMIDHCAFTGNFESGILVGPNAQVEITDSVVRDTGVGTATQYGYGVTVFEQANVSLLRSFVQDNSGIALAFDGVTAKVSDTWIARNKVGVAVANAELREVEQLPDEMASGVVTVHACRFIDNATRVGSGELPMPDFAELRSR